MKFGSKEHSQIIKIPRLRIVAATLAVLLFIGSFPVYYPRENCIFPILKSLSDSYRRRSFFPTIEKCDLFSGEWVPNGDAPYYTNETCWAIHEHQNCMKYGRPDLEFLKWRWKPFGCELPVIDPALFLRFMTNKSIAFVGDSLGRNQLQSLICLLSRVEYPVQTSSEKNDQESTWLYCVHNFTLASFWAPFLVRTSEHSSNGPTNTGIFNLFLDEFDQWTAQIDTFDYVIINSGRWFGRSSIYYENGAVTGCKYCLIDNVTELPFVYGYQRALRTAFRAINGRKSYKAVTFFRTIAPSHYDNGTWDNGGNCMRRKPWKSDEPSLRGEDYDRYVVQLKEFEVARREANKRGKRLVLMDSTWPMFLRPDGHPSKYGHRPSDKVTVNNDCVHWCLPGPVDSLNDIFFEMLRRREWEGDDTRGNFDA